MKIKDILNNKWSFKTQMLIARRIMKCSNLMKREIANWKRTGVVTNRKLSLMVDDSEQMTISINELIGTYGMDPLTAMLFFDDLIKANNNSDKTDLINLINRLKNGQRQKTLKPTAQMLNDIRRTQPGLWQEYERLKQKSAASEDANDEESIIQTELPE